LGDFPPIFENILVKRHLSSVVHNVALRKNLTIQATPACDTTRVTLH
jgi:hypothetical protein